MAYQATVPVHRRLLWSAVTDPERLLGAVPNLVVEAGSEHGVAARLRLRVGERSITFRGIARIVELAPEELRAVLEIEAVHGRSDGALDGRVELRLLPDGDGTRVVLDPDLVLSGHPPTVELDALLAAADRLIPRWFGQLAGAAPEQQLPPVALTLVPGAGASRDAADQDGAAGPAEAADPAAGTGIGDGPDPDPDEDDADGDPDEDGQPGRIRAAERTAPPSAPSPAPPVETYPAPVPAPFGEARPPRNFTVISGDAEDGRPVAKAPLRLVPGPAGGPEDELPEERDLWSERRGRFPAPLWVLGAALVGALALAAALLRLLRRGRRELD